MRFHPRLALILAALTLGCELETPDLDSGPRCIPDAAADTVSGDIDSPTTCQAVCTAAGRACSDDVTPPCYQQAGGALLQYESVEFVQACADRIAPTFQGSEGRLSLTSITCFCGP